jgi:IS4 transposase
MRPGIEKDEILGMLNDMAHSLEVTDMNLHDLLTETRKTMYGTHSRHLAETSILLEKMEGKLPHPMTPALHAKHEQTSLKLELSF